jgi:hypothetical protein
MKSAGIARSRLLVLSLFVLATAAFADDFPKFRPGLWEFKRTVEGAKGTTKPIVTELQKCTDPTENFTKRGELPGCKLTPMTRKGSTYSFTVDCNIKGVDVHSGSATVVESDSAYKLTIETTAGDRHTREVLVAKRIGDCKK